MKMEPSFLDAIFGGHGPAVEGAGSYGHDRRGGEEAWPERAERLQAAAAHHLAGKVVDQDQTQLLLESLLRPGDTVALEGSADKQAEFLTAALAGMGTGSVQGLHLVLPVLALPEQLRLLESGAISRFSYASAGAMAARMSEACQAGHVQVVTQEPQARLLSRQLLDLPVQVAVVAADEADEWGNLCTGSRPGDTRSIARNAHVRGGIVVAQVNRVVGRLKRVDVPGEWVDFVIPVPAGQEPGPMATLDPVRITPTQVLLALMLLRGIYAEYRVATICHDNGPVAAAAELLLPTVGCDLGLRGKACSHWVGVPRPSLIPAVESGFVARVLPLSAEPGMERYMAARPHVFPVGRQGQPVVGSWEATAMGGLAASLFLRTPVAVDALGSGVVEPSSTILGGGSEGRPLVVQVCETFRTARNPSFVASLPAGAVLPGDEVTHIVTEAGIADLRRCETAAERKAAISAVAGYTELGLGADTEAVTRLRGLGAVRTVADLGIDRREATLDLLAARQLRDLAEWSGGLYEPPHRMRNW